METASKTIRDGKPVTTGIIRYLRPVAEFLDRKALNGAFPSLTTIYAADNLGGITFAFEIEHDTELLHVGYAVCSENFNKEVGRRVALEMLNSPDRLTLKHDKEAALVEQTVAAVKAGQFPDNLRLQSLRQQLKRTDNPYVTTNAEDRWSKALKKIKRG